MGNAHSPLLPYSYAPLALAVVPPVLVGLVAGAGLEAEARQQHLGGVGGRGKGPIVGGSCMGQGGRCYAEHDVAAGGETGMRRAPSRLGLHSKQKGGI